MNIIFSQTKRENGHNTILRNGYSTSSGKETCGAAQMRKFGIWAQVPAQCKWYIVQEGSKCPNPTANWFKISALWKFDLTS